MIVYQNFEWDFREAAENFDTYGVPFREAATIFTAEDVAITEDVGSHQFFARGSSWRGRVLVVQHTRGVRIRILRAMVQQEEAKDANEVDATEMVKTTEARDTASTENVVAQVTDAASGPHEAVVATDPVDDVVARKPDETAAGTLSVGVPKAADLAKTGEDNVEKKTVTEVVVANEVAEPGEPAPAVRPRRRIIPFRPRSEDTNPHVPEGSDVTSAKTANVEAVKPDAAIIKAKEIPAPGAPLPVRRRGQPRRVPREEVTTPLPGFVDETKTSKTNAAVKAVAEPVPKPEETPTPKPPVEPARRRGRPRAEAPKSTTQLVLEFTKTERNEPEEVAKAAPASSRLPGAGMTADEYGIYWDAYSAARDEAKLQGKSLNVAQRLGREAGERAVSLRTPTLEPVKPSPKPAPAKKGSSWRAAARDVKPAR